MRDFGLGPESVGLRLKRLRVSRGLSQRDLSSPGVSYAYISRIEAGARTPSVKALRKLAVKLGVSVQFLETGEAGPIEKACEVAGLPLPDLSEADLAEVQRVSDAWAYSGAYEALLNVLAKRRRARLEQLEREAAEIRRVEQAVS